MTDTDLLHSIPAKDWEATPASVRQLLLSLLPLAGEVSELRARLNLHATPDNEEKQPEMSDQRARIARYQSLVDRSFLNDLTPEEQQEMECLGVEIDAGNAPFFQAALQRMQTEANARK
jgi:hypothetical protein